MEYKIYFERNWGVKRLYIYFEVYKSYEGFVVKACGMVAAIGLLNVLYFWCFNIYKLLSSYWFLCCSYVAIAA